MEQAASMTCQTLVGHLRITISLVKREHTSRFSSDESFGITVCDADAYSAPYTANAISGRHTPRSTRTPGDCRGDTPHFSGLMPGSRLAVVQRQIDGLDSDHAIVMLRQMAVLSSWSPRTKTPSTQNARLGNPGERLRVLVHIFPLAPGSFRPGSTNNKMRRPWAKTPQGRIAPTVRRRARVESSGLRSSVQSNFFRWAKTASPIPQSDELHLGRIPPQAATR